jgi:hypothetical protein
MIKSVSSLDIDHARHVFLKFGLFNRRARLFPEKRPECILSKSESDRTKDTDTHERMITQAEM